MLIRRKEWTITQREMMAAAGRYYGIRLAFAILLVGGVTFGFIESNMRAAYQARLVRASEAKAEYHSVESQLSNLRFLVEFVSRSDGLEGALIKLKDDDFMLDEGRFSKSKALSRFAIAVNAIKEGLDEQKRTQFQNTVSLTRYADKTYDLIRFSERFHIIYLVLWFLFIYWSLLSRNGSSVPMKPSEQNPETRKPPRM